MRTDAYVDNKAKPKTPPKEEPFRQSSFSSEQTETANGTSSASYFEQDQIHANLYLENVSNYTAEQLNQVYRHFPSLLEDCGVNDDALKSASI